MSINLASPNYRPQCGHCGRFIKMSGRYGWEATGEFGEETEYVCSQCLNKGIKPQASNGSRDARWCGVVEAR